MSKYWVIGGEYTSTAFDKIVPGKTEERYGPYTSLNEARVQWQRVSWQRVDNCNVRYRIVEDQDNAQPEPRRAAG